MSPSTQPAKIEKLDAITFDTLLSQQDPFSSSKPIFDLSTVKWVSPAGLVQLAAACYWVNQDGKQATIIVHNESVRGYLVRSGFVNAVNKAAQFKPSFGTLASFSFQYYRGTNPLLIEVTKIQAGSALPQILDQVVKVLRHRLKYSKYDAFDIATAVSEVCQNTFDHNQKTCGFIAMQVYGQAPNRFLEIGIADFGEGLTATLRRNQKYQQINSDLDAIQLAMKLGVSEHDDPTRGTGLHHLLEISFKHSGAVQIRSGAGVMRFRMDRRQGWGFTVAHLPGVHVSLALHSKVKS